MERAKAGARAWQMAHAHETSLAWRHYMALRGAAAYSAVGLGDLFENLSPYDGPNLNGRRRGRRNGVYGGWGTQIKERHAQASMLTLAEKLTGLDEPKLQLVGTDLEWEKRRQGIWADRFSEGCMHQMQGSFRDTWDVARHGFLLAGSSTGTVAARTEPDYVSKRVRTQLRSTLQTFIDPGDMANGQPLSFFDITWENPEYMCEDPRFTAAQRDQIWKASVIPPQHVAGNYDGAVFGTRMVKWLSAWRMPFGTFKGREAVFVDGGDPIIWEDWDRPRPPLAFFGMNRCLGESFWSQNLIEIMLDPLADAEDIDDIIKNTMAKTSQTNIIADGTTKLPKEAMNAKDVQVFRFDSKKGEKAPQVDKPGILHPDYFNHRDRKIAIARQLSGIPDMHITSESPGGTDSGRAKRLEASLLPERFAKILRGWRNWVACSIGGDQIRAARMIGKVEPNWQVTWPGADFDAKVPVKVLDLDDSLYEIREYAVSEQKNTPQERAQYAQELFANKQIDGSQLDMILNGIYDVPKETKESSTQQKLLAMIVDDILHCDQKFVANENQYMAERYTPPDPWIDPPSALSQVIPQYRQAMIDGVPQNRRNLLRRLVTDILQIKSNNDKAEAMANAKVTVQATPQQAFPSGGPEQALPPGPGPGATAQPMQGAPGAPGAPAPLNVGGQPGLA